MQLFFPVADDFRNVFLVHYLTSKEGKVLIVFIFLEETNKCSSNPCLYGATCTNILNGYTCACSANFTGPRCEVATGKVFLHRHDDITKSEQKELFD